VDYYWYVAPLAINPNAKYIQAGLGAIANLGRNSFRSPSLNVWNMAVFNNNKLTERFGVVPRRSL
jgi:hypothetical protein